MFYLVQETAHNEGGISCCDSSMRLHKGRFQLAHLLWRRWSNSIVICDWLGLPYLEGAGLIQAVINGRNIYIPGTNRVSTS